MSLEIKRLTVGPVMTNCYVVNLKGSEEAVIVDPGDDAYKIELKLNEWKLKPVAILLTHGHFDHIRAVSKLKEHYGIKVYALDKEKEILNSELNLSRAFGFEMISIEADVYLSDNQMINVAGIDFKVLHTPGHTIGSCCYYAESEKVLFSGDTLFFHSHGRTDFPTGSQSAIIRSITGKLLTLDEDVMVYPGHESLTCIADEKQYNPFV